MSATPKQRDKVLALVRDSLEPLDAPVIARSLGIHITTARFHLNALIDDGLVEGTWLPSATVGRPRKGYVALGADPTAPLLDALLAQLGDSSTERGAKAAAAGQVWADTLAVVGGGATDLPDPVTVVTTTLTRLGFQVSSTVSSFGTHEIQWGNPGPGHALRIVAAQVFRGVAAEWTRTSGRSFLWTVAVPLTYGLPLLVTFGIAAVAERFATIPGQIGVTSSTTTNSVYWVVTLSVSIMMVAAAYAQATQWRGQTGDLNAFLFPRTWTAALARWVFYGLFSAGSTVVLLALVMIALPHWFPHVYGEVNIADAAGIRFLWTVPIYAFAACGIGIAVAALIRAPAAAVAVLLFWAYVGENSMSLLPNGYTLQAYAPFLNGVAATGQEMAFMPRFGRNGSLLYFLGTTAVLFVVAACLPAIATLGRTAAAALRSGRR